MIFNALFKAQQFSGILLDQNTCATASALFVRHANGTVVYGVGVAVARVEQIKGFAGVIQFSSVIEILGSSDSNLCLEGALPIGDGFMIRLCRRGEIIWGVVPHFMVVAVHMRHPVMVYLRTHLTFNLLLPRPIAVQIKQVMIGPASGPWFIVLESNRVGIGVRRGILIEPVGISVVAIGV